MRESEFNAFGEMLDAAYDLLGNGKLISASSKAMFWNAMADVSLEEFRWALSEHCKASSFAPKPADIFRQLDRAKPSDGHPSPEEAWATALLSADESKTVVLTAQIMEAFQICRPVLDTSGAISARKTFIEAYERILTESRRNGVKAQFFASLGSDADQREQPIKAAASAGLLPAPMVRDLLPPPAKVTEDGRAQLAKIRAMLKPNIERESARDQAKAAEIAQIRLKKTQIQQQIERRGVP